MAAWCYAWRKINGWMTDRTQEIAETARLARRAAELGPDDAVALSRGAHALGYVVGDLDAAATFVDRALALNPNLAGAWYASGWVRVFLGESDVAIKHFAQAMRLSPLDPHSIGMQAGTAFAHFLAGRFDEASLWAGKAMWEHTNYLTTLVVAAASNALAGRPAEAQNTWFACASSIPRCELATSRTGPRFADRKTSQSLRKACGKPACRNKANVRYWHLADIG